MTAKEEKGKNKRDGEGSASAPKKIKKRRKRNQETRKNQRKKGKKVKKLKLQSPLQLTEDDKCLLEELKRSGNIMAWLDYESIGKPSSGIFDMILRKFRAKGYKGLLDLHVFVGYLGDDVPEKENPTQGSFQIHYRHDYPRPPGTRGNQAADKCLKEFLDNLPPGMPPHNMLIISNDNGFRPWLDTLRGRGDIVLLARTQESKILRGGAHKHWNWNEKFLPFHRENQNDEDDDDQDDQEEEDEDEDDQEEEDDE